MKYAIIENGIVINVAEALEPLGANWVQSDTASIGDAYNGTQFTAPTPVVVVPIEISARQARLALLGAGLLADVDTAIAAMPSPDKEQAQIEWQYATTINRNHPFVVNLGAALGLSNAQLDDLFIAGAAL